MTVAVLVLGAGRGERFQASLPPNAGGGVAKALVRLGGRSLLARSLNAMARSAAVDIVQPVLSEDGLNHWDTVLPECDPFEGLREPVRGGAERVDSVRCGLAALEASVAWVAVHDAARPLVPVVDVDRVIAAAQAEGAAVLVTPVTDTIHRVEEGWVVETPNRQGLFAAATPQAFRRDWLEEALTEAVGFGDRATDDAGLVARLGHPVRVVLGDPANTKITTESDRLAAERWLMTQEAS